MGENEIEVITILSRKDNSLRMPGSKQNLGHKRRRSVTPMRPVAIAPKTNFSKNFQNVELAIKAEPAGFITLVPRPNDVSSENHQSNNKSSIAKTDQFGTFESLNGLQNSKRIKLGNDDDNVPMQYIILQDRSLDHCNTILITDNEDSISNQQEYTILRNNVSNNGILQQYNVVDKSDLTNSVTTSLGILPKSNFNQQEVSTVPNSKKIHFNSMQKNNSMESPHSSAQRIYNINDSRMLISRNVTTNNIIEKSDPLNVVPSIESLETLESLKLKSQKPVVIMQQQLSPPNKTSSVKTKQISISGFTKLIPIDIQGVNIESKIISKQASPQKTNENFHHTKSMSHNQTRVNNEEQETDFLLKKEFPVISSSQVDSVLKAIDMQVLSRGILSNEVNNHLIKESGDNKDANDIGQSLPCIQGAAKLCKNENTQCANTVNSPLIKIQTNQSIRRLQADKQTDNYSKGVERLGDTLQCYKCKECSYMSLNEKHISEHIEKEHVNVSESKKKPVFKCPGCSNTFHYETSLLSHIVHDHQVHESEARIMVHQLTYKQSLNLNRNNSTKPISQIHISTIQNEQNFANHMSDPLLVNNERSRIHSTLSLPKTTSVSSVQAEPFPSESNAMCEMNGLEYNMPNINDMPVVVQNCVKTVEVNPFLNEGNECLPKSDVQQNQGVKSGENKNVDCLEKPNLFELKNASERNFEFVNFKNVAHNDGDAYLQEDDSTERGISDTEMEFTDLAVKESAFQKANLDSKIVGIKKKGRPKGSKSYATKPQLISFKQGYKCDIEECAVRMLVQENIAYHRKCHVVTTTPTTTTLQRNFNFHCPECIEFKSNNWNNLAGHLWRSHIIDMELHSCDLCSYKTPSFSHLTNQHRGIHGDDRPFVCEDCGKGFKTTKQLRNHKALHNAKTKQPLKCDECKRDFTNTRLLKLHKDSVHKESKPFTCSSCPYSAATRSALKLHLRRHTGEKPFSCEQCSYSTGDHNSLRRHKLRHLGLKPYSCPHCSYACIQSSTYKVHLKNKHPGLDHDLMFSCQYCSYKSIKKDNLLTHMAKHEQVSSSKTLIRSESSIL